MLMQVTVWLIFTNQKLENRVPFKRKYIFWVIV